MKCKYVFRLFIDLYVYRMGIVNEIKIDIDRYRSIWILMERIGEFGMIEVIDRQRGCSLSESHKKVAKEVV